MHQLAWKHRVRRLFGIMRVCSNSSRRKASALGKQKHNVTLMAADIVLSKKETYKVPPRFHHHLESSSKASSPLNRIPTSARGAQALFDMVLACYRTCITVQSVFPGSDHQSSRALTYVDVDCTTVAAAVVLHKMPH